MNFLGHAKSALLAFEWGDDKRVAEFGPADRAQFTIGAILPDLLNSRRPRMKLLPLEGLTPALRAQAQELPQPFLLGIRYHLQCDKVWHAGSWFIEAEHHSEKLLREMGLPEHRKALGLKQPRLFFLRHIAVEMALDHLLARDEEENSHAVTDAWDRFERRHWCRWMSAVVRPPKHPDTLEDQLAWLFAALERFGGGHFLHHYAEVDMLVEATRRIVKRVDQAAYESDIWDGMDAFYADLAAWMEPRLPELWPIFKKATALV